MVELMEKRKIKKRHDHYLHTIEVIYPIVNVENMIKNWTKAVEQYEDWLKEYDNYVEESKKNAEKAIKEGIQTFEDEINHVLGLTDEDKFKYWNEIFIQQCDELNKMKESEDKLIQEQEVKNLELLKKYKASYEHELKNKREALKQWKSAK